MQGICMRQESESSTLQMWKHQIQKSGSIAIFPPGQMATLSDCEEIISSCESFSETTIMKLEMFVLPSPQFNFRALSLCSCVIHLIEVTLDRSFIVYCTHIYCAFVYSSVRYIHVCSFHGHYCNFCCDVVCYPSRPF